MEPETFLTKQQDNEKCVTAVETIVDEGNVAEKLNDNTVEVDVVAIQVDEPVVVREQLVPDLTLFCYEVQQGYRIFRELLSDQYKSIIYPFMQPVDVEGLNLWDYHTRIETPMSFSQIEKKFLNYEYESITAVVSDMRLILENCYRYNGSGHWISKLAHKLEKILDQKLALLNRSLREKVTLRATMAFRNRRDTVSHMEETDLGGRRRRSGRTSYGMNGMNTEEQSSLMNHLLMEEEENQKEMRRIKEKEKKEANEMLMQELNEWENQIFTKKVLAELKSIWEVPSIGSFLWLFQAALNLPELNFSEFENGLILPHKSQQMAWIFTSLLVTPSQRKSIHKKSPMRFKVWEQKLKERLDIWYLARQDEELQMVGRQIGLNLTFFEILGETNPLQTKSYIDLTLHQRVLVLKVLCDECLDYHPQLRDVLGNTDTTPYSETYLGYDAQNSTYLYFPIFDSTDIRIYKQVEQPGLNEWYRKWMSASKAFSRLQTPRQSSQTKSRRSSISKSSKKKKVSQTTIEPGFELICNDIESLRELCEKFSEKPPPASSRRKSGSRPATRKRCEKDLHQVLCGLLEDLARNDARYSRARVKGMLNLMRDWKSVDSEDEINSAKDDETEEATTENRHTLLGNQSDIPDCKDTEDIPGEDGPPLLSMVTRSRKRKFLDYDDMISASSSPVSEISKNFESDSRIEERAEKRPNLGYDVVQDSEKFNDMCETIVRDVMHDVIRAIVDDVIGGVVDDAISKLSVLESDGSSMNGVDSDEHLGTTVAQKEHDETVKITGLETEDEIEDPIKASVDNNEQSLMETGSSENKDIDCEKGTEMDINGCDDRQEQETVMDAISLITNGHKEENVVELKCELSEITKVKPCSIMNTHVNGEISNIPCESNQNNHGSQGINETNMNNGGCSETTSVHNGDLVIDGRIPRKLLEKESPRIVPTENEPTGMLCKRNESTQMLSTGNEPTVMISVGNLSDGKDEVPSNEIH